MTDIRKPVSRRTVGPNYMGRRVVVSIMPGDVIGVREERTRRTYTAPVSKVWAAIVRWNAEAERAAKRAARKGGGR